MKFAFKGLHGYPSECDVHIANNVVVVSELPDNPGTSVTNAWPLLADAIYNQMLANQERSSIVWIEHYPQRGRLAPTWELVHMNWNGQRFQMATDKHPWQTLTEEKVRELQNE
jgi:hypothetical protein